MRTEKTNEATKLINRLVGDDQELREMIAAEHLNARVARMIFDARVEAGLTQKQLAEIVGTTQSVIARLESGRAKPSTKTLERLAIATDTRLRIIFEAPV